MFSLVGLDSHSLNYTSLSNHMQLAIVSRLKNEHFVALMGYCLEANNRILVYEYASLGSLHDTLHGTK